MANSVFDHNTGDIVTKFSEIKKTKMDQGFREIDYTDVTAMSQQHQIAPRQVRTGELRGDQQVRGLIKVEDRSGRIVMMFGYSPGAF
ncbi:hypothetical protein CQ476_42 [TM7 phage DolZOral124_53_65]|nr:hypothetical protein CQ476_42 [TM7 phage DolZOral124_53_65]